MNLFPRCAVFWASMMLCAPLLIGCSGGGASLRTSTSLSTLRQSSSAAQTASAPANVTFAIGITLRATSGKVMPDYISPTSQSVAILTDGLNRVVVNLTPSSPNCSPDVAHPNSYVCTAALNVPTGNHLFTVTAYDLVRAKGNVLSTDTAGPFFVKPTGITKIGMVLEGSVKNVVLALADGGPLVGVPAKIGLTVTVQDADANAIVGPAAYEYPVTLTTTDAVNGPLSKTLLHSPRDAAGITVSYTGAKVASITYSATAVGLAATNVSNAVLVPAFANGAFLYRFPNAASGAHPNAALLADRAGNLYGTTSGGGTSNGGTAFKLTRTGDRYTPSVLYNFGSSASDGTSPVGGLISDGSGALYGVTSAGGVGPPGGGIAGWGTVFKLTPAGAGYAESIIYGFASGTWCGEGPGTDRAFPPRASLPTSRVRSMERRSAEGFPARGLFTS